MTNEGLIVALLECENCNVCSIADDGDCPFGGRNALEVAAADALEAAEKRIAQLEEDLKTREAEREVMQDTIKICEEAADRYKAQLPKEAEWITTRTENHDGEIYCSACDYDAPTEGDYRQVKTNYCPNCGARMKGEQE